jgi:periplasmic divalent cation tolerance protein
MNELNPLAVVITTVESEQDAEALAKSLIDQSLGACVQIDGPITSHYRWSGKVEQAKEYRLTIKTTRQAWPALKEKLAKMHPYEEPQIVMISVDDASDGYRNWVVDQTT